MTPQELEQKIDEFVEQAIELRFSIRENKPQTLKTPQAQVEEILRVRDALDRIDEIYVSLSKARTITKLNFQSLSFEAEASFDRALDRVRRNPGSRGEYVGAKERMSEANLLSFDEKKSALDSQRLSTLADHAYETVRKLHRDLDSYRLDIHAIMKSTAFELNIDR